MVAGFKHEFPLSAERIARQVDRKYGGLFQRLIDDVDVLRLTLQVKQQILIVFVVGRAWIPEVDDCLRWVLS